ncbi:MAG: polysaccharide biosynthesis tyrosine autokinase [Chitinophagaceae bacterium]|nr:polysaccharide biosynthesis tyrosine autokinase [Chitinophagaceae bacterium]
MNLSTNTKELREAANFQKQFAVQFSLKEILFKYLSYLPFILLILAISVGVGYVYIRYTEPIYKASTQILVKFEETKSSLNDPNDLIQKALRESKVLNLDNEITKLRSLSLLKRVVDEGKFNKKVRNIGRFRSTTLYYDSPVSFDLLKVADSSATLHVRFKRFSNKYAYVDKDLNNNSFPDSIAYGKRINVSGFEFAVAKKYEFGVFNEPISFIYEPSIVTARNILSSLSVTAVGKTSVLQLEMRDDNPVRAKEILNQVVKVFKEQDIETKRIASINTVAFINDRMQDVIDELDSAESKILSLKSGTDLGDVDMATGFYRDKLLRAEEKNTQIAMQLELVKMLSEYMQKSSNNTLRPVPVDLGIDNSFLNAALKQYNDLALAYERDKEQLALNPDNKILADYSNRIKEIKYNIDEILKNIKLDFQRKLEDGRNKIELSRKQLTLLPETDRQLKNMQTQVAIKKELYFYLLKRKEEVGITSATFTSSYEAIDAASASNYPVEPKVSNIRNFSILIGLIIPIFIIYLIDLLNDKITVREQVQKKLNLPIAGEVSHVANPSKFVFNQNRSLVAEQFRILRSNLAFLFKGIENSKVVLISSTVSGEGKSFVSTNLAAALSLSEKKVALLLFDLRKSNIPPALEQVILSKSSKGITNYLIGQTDDIAGIHVVDEGYPSLHVYPSGPIPPNPAELLLSPNTGKLFEYLRNNYDFVIVDSAPAGLVSDAFILQQYVDATLYIIRQRFTLLKQLDFIDEIYHTEKLKNISLVVNDVTMGGRYGYYGYNYGYGYGYSYQYVYGYGLSKKRVSNYYSNYDEGLNSPWWTSILTFFKK